MSKKMSFNNGKDVLDEEIITKLHETAQSLVRSLKRNKIQTLLFSSINDGEGVASAVLHIAYIISRMKQKVLLINLDPLSLEYFKDYLDVKEEPKLLSTLQSSGYLSEAIDGTGFDLIDYIGIEDVEEADAANILNGSGVEERLLPLSNYFDCIFIVGPEYAFSDEYGHIFGLAEGAVTISKDKTSDYRKLRGYLNALKYYNVHSFGLIRHT